MTLASTKLIRVTMEKDGEFVNRMYSYWPTVWVGDGAALLFAGHVDGVPRFFRVNLVSGAVERLGSLLPYRGTAEGWYFDADGWIYLCHGPCLRRVHPMTGEDRVVFNIGLTMPDCRVWQAHSSDDGRRHSATVEQAVPDGPYRRLGTVVSIDGDLTMYPAEGVLDESQITPDGEWLIIKEDDNNRIVNLNTGEIRRLANAGGAVGHSDCGRGFVVGEDDIHGACVLWDLRQPLVSANRRELFRTWSMGHVAVRGERCLLSTGTYLGLVDLQTGAGTPLRTHDMVGDGYDYQVRACLDPTGRVACFMSNRGSSRFDVFLLVLEDGPRQDEEEPLMSEPMQRQDLPHGYFGPHRDNEVRLVSTRADPVKYRGAVVANVADQVTNLAALSGNVERADGEQEEYGYVMIRKFPDGSGAIYFAVRFPGEQQPREVCFMGINGLISQVPVQAPGGGSGGPVTRFYSDDRRYCFNVQGDGGGKIVQYEVTGPDESQWRPVAQWKGTPL